MHSSSATGEGVRAPASRAPLGPARALGAPRGTSGQPCLGSLGIAPSSLSWELPEGDVLLRFVLLCFALFGFERCQQHRRIMMFHRET